MKKISAILTLAASALMLNASSQRMSLEWSPDYPTGTAYEVEINRAKLNKLAGVDTKTSFDVFAVVNGKEQKLDVKLFPGQKKDCPYVSRS